VTISKVYTAAVSAFTNKRGAAMVEYALLAGLIAVVALTTLSGLGNNIKNQFSSISSSL
jgi:Flp pilus assembly pilin Flp